MDEEKSYAASIGSKAMSFKRQCFKLEFFSNPKIIGSVSLAWTVILLFYLFRVSIVSHLPSQLYNRSMIYTFTNEMKARCTR